MSALIPILRTLYHHPYNRERPIFALFRLAIWQFRKHVKRVPAIYPFWGTRNIVCYPDSSESMWLVYNYYMDWDEFHFIKRYVKSENVVFDVGANIGVYSLWLSQFAKHVTAFEPDPQNHARCAHNLWLNDMSVTLEPLALSDRQGMMQFSVGHDQENHLIPDGIVSSQSISVKATRLDTYCSTRGIDKINFMKVDVEGAELMVLRGAAQMLAAGRIDVIQLELNESLKRYGLEHSDVTSALGDYGYKLYSYDSGSNQLTPLHDKPPQNVFAIRNIDGVRAVLAHLPVD